MSAAQDEAIARLREVDSGQVSDAMEEAGLPRSVLLSFRRFGAGMQPMVGPAFTMWQVRKPAGTSREERRVRCAAAAVQCGQLFAIATGVAVAANPRTPRNARNAVNIKPVGVAA